MDMAEPSTGCDESMDFDKNGNLKITENSPGTNTNNNRNSPTTDHKAAADKACPGETESLGTTLVDPSNIAKNDKTSANNSIISPSQGTVHDKHHSQTVNTSVQTSPGTEYTTNPPIHDADNSDISSSAIIDSSKTSPKSDGNENLDNIENSVQNTFESDASKSSTATHTSKTSAKSDENLENMENSHTKAPQQEYGENESLKQNEGAYDDSCKTGHSKTTPAQVAVDVETPAITDASKTPPKSGENEHLEYTENIDLNSHKNFHTKTSSPEQDTICSDTYTDNVMGCSSKTESDDSPSNNLEAECLNTSTNTNNNRNSPTTDHKTAADKASHTKTSSVQNTKNPPVPDAVNLDTSASSSVIIDSSKTSPKSYGTEYTTIPPNLEYTDNSPKSSHTKTPSVQNTFESDASKSSTATHTSKTSAKSDGNLENMENSHTKAPQQDYGENGSLKQKKDAYDDSCNTRHSKTTPAQAAVDVETPAITDASKTSPKSDENDNLDKIENSSGTEYTKNPPLHDAGNSDISASSSAIIDSSKTSPKSDGIENVDKIENSPETEYATNPPVHDAVNLEIDHGTALNIDTFTLADISSPAAQRNAKMSDNSSNIVGGEECTQIDATIPTTLPDTEGSSIFVETAGDNEVSTSLNCNQGHDSYSATASTHTPSQLSQKMRPVLFSPHSHMPQNTTPRNHSQSGNVKLDMTSVQNTSESDTSKTTHTSKTSAKSNGNRNIENMENTPTNGYAKAPPPDNGENENLKQFEGAYDDSRNTGHSKTTPALLDGVNFETPAIDSATMHDDLIQTDQNQVSTQTYQGFINNKPHIPHEERFPSPLLGTNDTSLGTSGFVFETPAIDSATMHDNLIQTDQNQVSTQIYQEFINYKPHIPHEERFLANHSLEQAPPSPLLGTNDTSLGTSGFDLNSQTETPTYSSTGKNHDQMIPFTTIETIAGDTSAVFTRTSLTTSESALNVTESIQLPSTTQVLNLFTSRSPLTTSVSAINTTRIPENKPPIPVNPSAFQFGTTNNIVTPINQKSDRGMSRKGIRKSTKMTTSTKSTPSAFQFTAKKDTSVATETNEQDDLSKSTSLQKVSTENKTSFPTFTTSGIFGNINTFSTFSGADAQMSTSSPSPISKSSAAITDAHVTTAEGQKSYSNENSNASVTVSRCNGKDGASIKDRSQKGGHIADHKKSLVDEQIGHSIDFCQNHRLKRAGVYCHDCAVTVCVACYFKSHNKHNVEDLQDFGMHIRKELEKIKIDAQIEIDRLRKSRMRLYQEQSELRKVGFIADERINARASKLCGFINSRGETLKNELGRQRERSKRQLKARIENSKQPEEKLQSISKEIAKSMNSISVVEANAKMLHFQKELNEIRVMEEQRPSQVLANPEFCEGDIDADGLADMFGSLSISADGYQQSSSEVQCQSMKDIEISDSNINAEFQAPSITDDEISEDGRTKVNLEILDIVKTEVTSQLSKLINIPATIDDLGQDQILRGIFDKAEVKTSSERNIQQNNTSKFTTFSDQMRSGVQNHIPADPSIYLSNNPLTPTTVQNGPSGAKIYSTPEPFTFKTTFHPQCSIYVPLISDVQESLCFKANSQLNTALSTPSERQVSGASEPFSLKTTSESNLHHSWLSGSLISNELQPSSSMASVQSQSPQSNQMGSMIYGMQPLSTINGVQSPQVFGNPNTPQGPAVNSAQLFRKTQNQPIIFTNRNTGRHETTQNRHDTTDFNTVSGFRVISCESSNKTQEQPRQTSRVNGRRDDLKVNRPVHNPSTIPWVITVFGETDIGIILKLDVDRKYFRGSVKAEFSMKLVNKDNSRSLLRSAFYEFTAESHYEWRNIFPWELLSDSRNGFVDDNGLYHMTLDAITQTIETPETAI